MQCFLVIDDLKEHFIKQKAPKIGKLLKKTDLTKAITKLYKDAYGTKFEGNDLLNFNTVDISQILSAIRVDPIHYKDVLIGKMFKYFIDKVHNEMKPITHQNFSSKKHK